MSDLPRHTARVLKTYAELTPGALRAWLNEEYPPHKKLFDPVKAMLETEFPGVYVETGFERFRVWSADDKVQAEMPVHDWHDVLLAQVVNGATSPDGHLHGFCDVGNVYEATVETHCGLLARHPRYPFAARVRDLSSALKTAFLTIARKVRPS